MRTEVDSKAMMKHPLRFIAIGFGSGLVPTMPGTAGTVVAIPLVLTALELPVFAYLLLTLLFFILGIWACDEAIRYLKVHDHPAIVCDEMVGFMIAMAGAPRNWKVIAIGFLAFRFFDIVKPWPIRWLDRHAKGGFGVMIDDVLAGIYAAAVLQLGLVLIRQ